MRTFGHFSSGNLLECVDALAGAVEGVHEMHGCGLRCAERFKIEICAAGNVRSRFPFGAMEEVCVRFE